MKRFVIASIVTGIAFGLLQTLIGWIMRDGGAVADSVAFGATIAALVHIFGIPRALAKVPHSLFNMIFGNLLLIAVAEVTYWSSARAFPAGTFTPPDIIFGWSLIGAMASALVLGLCVRIFRSIRDAGKAPT